MPNDTFNQQIQNLYSRILLNRESSNTHSLLETIINTDKKIGIVFSGQGSDTLAELRALHDHSDRAREFIVLADQHLRQWVKQPNILSRGMFAFGVNPLEWITKDRTPPAAYLTSTAVSHPLIFIAQVAQLLSNAENGLDNLFINNHVEFIAGYSQGLLAALLVAEENGNIQPERAIEYLEYCFWQGIILEQQWNRLNPRESAGLTPMAMLSGIDQATLEHAIANTQALLEDGEVLSLAIEATRNRFVVSGPETALELLKECLSQHQERLHNRRKAGQHGGNIPSFGWEQVPVNAAFHNPMLAPAMDEMKARCAELNFDIKPLNLPVLCYDHVGGMSTQENVLEHLIHSQFVLPVRWSSTMLNVARQQKVDCILDLGPGDGTGKLCAANLRGSGIETISLTTTAGQQRLFTPGSVAPALQSWSEYAPRVLRSNDGQLRIDNRFVRATGRQPIILPGMTPTTSDAELVSAAANAGFVAELAGGGQVNADVFWKRMEDLKQQLDPGTGVVFNALYLDRYLWDLHFGNHNLVLRARQAGYPIYGVTISAGIPEVEEAAVLLRRFNANGMWLNAIKAGNVQQIKQIVQIAKAVPEHKLFIHVEGGKAGGHHSWEDLEQLLLDGYHLIRSCPNLILCVGGGIATEARATELLNGSWAAAHNQLDMPVDAIFLGTLCMATAEAGTSPQVKQALVDAKGAAEWVFAGSSKGQITSGKSQLNADIHYVENAAAICGRLLDKVAGDAEAVEQHRAQLIAALSETAKPYFGDIADMSYAQLLNRMLELMAIGRSGRYEDGCWMDPSWRQRFADMLWRTEMRVHPEQEGKFVSILSKLDELDHPQRVMRTFLSRYPLASEQKIHPADADHFINAICRRPGKPVNFVPVIDADVRRWYKSDSLWQSHDDRYPADAVLIIPGPEAVAGLQRVNEPIADLFERFLTHTIDETGLSQATPLPLQAPAFQPEDLELDESGAESQITLQRDGVDWFEPLSALSFGVFSLWSSARILVGDRLEENPLRRLCKPVLGGILKIDAQRLSCWPNEGRATNVIVEESDAGSITISVTDSSLKPHNNSLLSLTFNKISSAGEALFQIDAEDYAHSIMRLYHLTLFDQEIPATPLFSAATDRVTFNAEEAQGYLQSLSEKGSTPTLNFMFTLGMKSIFSVLSCDELRGGLLDLVHLSNQGTAGPAWPPTAGERMQIQAQAERVETRSSGQEVEVRVTLKSSRGRIASSTAAFFIRRPPHSAMPKLLISRTLSESLFVSNETELKLLAELPCFTWRALPNVGDQLILNGSLSERHLWDQKHIFAGTGSVERDGIKIGTYTVDQRSPESIHPLRQLMELMTPAQPSKTAVRKLLADETCWAPSDMAGYAHVSGDHNPIHQSQVFAQLAQLEQPIVHGMWTAGRLHALLRQSLVDDAPERIASFEISFDSPLELGAELRLQLWKTGTDKGQIQCELRASTLTENGAVTVAQAKALVHPPRTAYVFPGQGIQSQGMGMELYQSSRAARAVWDRADTHTREALGFSILRVVQQNPAHLRIGRTSYRHPVGVLHLTQFTQVAMSIMAQAQIAWIKEEGLFVPDAITCGHSVGEYNALGAVLGVIPLEQTITVVWQRGLAMHQLVERDKHGRSAYAMGVIRPHYAGMNHQQAEDLVSTIAKQTDCFLQIVNYNVRGRQYSVTGDRTALRALEQALDAQSVSAKKAYIEVPGIDVPFHSTLLSSGVPAFRAALHSALPKTINPEQLIGRYIPNLTATPFQLSRDYAQEILAVVDSAPVQDALDNWDAAMRSPETLARTLLIELLAWQFASPVRWIETQDMLFTAAKKGGLGIQQLVEVGAATQPTLTNMAGYTLSLAKHPNPPAVFNIEAHTQELFGIDPEPSMLPEITTDAETEEAEAEITTASAAPTPSPTVTAATLVDQQPPHQSGLTFLISRQANLRPEQLAELETIDEIFEGVSSRRNQLLMDLGTEFGIGSIDAAHEKPLSELVEVLKQRAPSWSGGSYSNASIEETARKTFGRCGLSRADVDNRLESLFGLPAGLRKQAWMLLALESRSGDSVRGGSLGRLTDSPADRSAAERFLTEWMSTLGAMLNLSIAPLSSGTGGAAVDSAALNELREELLGEQGRLMSGLRSFAEELGQELHPARITAQDESNSPRADEEYTKRIQPLFSAEKHSPFLSVWAAAQAETAALLHQGLLGTLNPIDLWRSVERLSAFGQDPRVRSTAQWAEKRALAAQRPDLVAAFARITDEQPATALPITPTRPQLQIDQGGTIHYYEHSTPDYTVMSFIEQFFAKHSSENSELFRSCMEWTATQPSDFSEHTVLMTGASPDSIAVEMLKHLLRGNARVVVTTTSCNAKRMRFYRDLYNKEAGPKAQLHVLPFNQASTEDVDQLCDWLFDVDRDLRPNLVIPFGAMKSAGSLAELSGKSEAAMRAMLVGVELLVSQIGERLLKEGGGHCHVILPLSPNHGSFGGDGLYAESKAALEVLMNKCVSERNQWARHITICGARIGWVRGTGLMNDNNIFASELEQRLSVSTYSTAEMGLLLTTLCATEMIDLCDPVLHVDLSGGLANSSELRQTVEDIRGKIEQETRSRKSLEQLRQHFRISRADRRHLLDALPLDNKPASTIAFEQSNVDPSEMVVIVGYGEMGPCGSSRTRFAMEFGDELAPAAVAELAWITGKIRYEQNGWVDVETGARVEESQLSQRYRNEVQECAGIRFIDPETTGFDTQHIQGWTIAHLDRSFRFNVTSQHEAETFQACDPQKVSVTKTNDGWEVSLQAGAQIRLPKRTTLTRHVGAPIPDGFDFSRYGIPKDMQETVDRLTLFNLVATVDAWISAGLTPAELLRHLHPARVGNTQSSGIGGMRSLAKLYIDPVLTEERQNDILQETLLNVMAAYAVQSYVGSYGPMAHPVGACATAALSVEAAMEKIQLGKADFVVAGGFDDLDVAGMIGFADMNATAPTQEMLDRGLEPREFSRSNDIRRGGFVEAQGGGTLLLTRGDIAIKLGLPVRGVLACAGSFSDGVHRSIPAPGRGLLAIAAGREHSMLGSALNRYGLSTDDISVVYKHDTSTTANDLNENELHHRIQEHLGRSSGNPLWVVSQKTVTGHSKGGAAAWQLIGLCQALEQQRIPGNRNLACVDPEMRRFQHMVFSDQDLRFAQQEPLKAGLVTSLGFGHVNAGLLVLHPGVFVNAIPSDQRERYEAQAETRLHQGSYLWQEIRMGNQPAFERAQHRRFAAKDGTKAQAEEESAMLLDTESRLIDGLYQGASK